MGVGYFSFLSTTNSFWLKMHQPARDLSGSLKTEGNFMPYRWKQCIGLGIQDPTCTYEGMWTCQFGINVPQSTNSTHVQASQQIKFQVPVQFWKIIKNPPQCLLHSMGEKIFAALQDKTLAQQQRAVNQNGVLPSHISHKLMWTVECFWYELTAKLLALQRGERLPFLFFSFFKWEKQKQKSFVLLKVFH